MAKVKNRLAKAYGNGNGEDPNPPVGSFLEIGRTGLRQFSGRIDEEPLTELKWENGRKIFREMSENDSTIGGLLNAITLMVRQARSYFDTDNENDPRVQFLEECRDDMDHSWTDLLAEIGRGTLVYGWQAHECVYKLRDGKNSQFSDGMIGWKKLAVRAQDTLYRWDYDPKTQELLAMIQRPAPDYKERRLPMDKLALFRTEMFKDNPEGRSILRNAYRAWYFKRGIENIEAIGIERDLAGFPVIYVPPKVIADTTLLQEFKDVATAIKRDEQEGAVLPSVYDEHGNRMYELTLLSAAGQRQFDTTAVITRYDLRILQIMLADFIQIGHDSVGSKALASTKTNLFLVAIGVFLDQIASVFNRQIIPRLLELNGMDVQDSPQLSFAELEQRDLTALGNYLTQLSAAGMPLFPNPKMEAALLNFADLPVPTPDEMAVRDQAIADEQQAQLDQQLAVAAAKKPPQGQPPANEPAKPEPAQKALEPSKVEAHFHVSQSAPPAQNITVTSAPSAPQKLELTLLTPKAEPAINNFTVEAAKAPDVKIDMAAAPAPHVTMNMTAPTFTVEAAKAPDVSVKVEAPVVQNQITTPEPKVELTVQAAAPIVVPPAVVTNIVEAPIVKQGDMIIQADLSPVVESIDRLREATKRPGKLTMTKPDGSQVTIEPESST